MTFSKLRDFWIGFTGDPKHATEAVQTRTIYLKPLRPLPGENIVHVREVPYNNCSSCKKVIPEDEAKAFGGLCVKCDELLHENYDNDYDYDDDDYGDNIEES